MDEIVCANTAFRYWRCPPQVRDIYPRLPSSDDGWRALSQAPFDRVENVGVRVTP